MTMDDGRSSRVVKLELLTLPGYLVTRVWTLGNSSFLLFYYNMYLQFLGRKFGNLHQYMKYIRGHNRKLYSITLDFFLQYLYFGYRHVRLFFVLSVPTFWISFIWATKQNWHQVATLSTHKRNQRCVRFSMVGILWIDCIKSCLHYDLLYDDIATNS